MTNPMIILAESICSRKYRIQFTLDRYIFVHFFILKQRCQTRDLKRKRNIHIGIVSKIAMITKRQNRNDTKRDKMFKIIAID